MFVSQTFMSIPGPLVGSHFRVSHSALQSDACEMFIKCTMGIVTVQNRRTVLSRHSFKKMLLYITYKINPTVFGIDCYRKIQRMISTHRLRGEFSFSHCELKLAGLVYQG
uniref:Uncharacterized protein n=1 Tax=Anguilla anguilla TaxID=7936 RepID=A0A0E9VUF3_ANGAN